MPLEAREVQCPYCGETIELEVESLEEKQSYIEDCAVCCRPIQYDIEPGPEGSEISATRSN